MKSKCYSLCIKMLFPLITLAWFINDHIHNYFCRIRHYYIAKVVRAFWLAAERALWTARRLFWLVTEANHLDTCNFPIRLKLCCGLFPTNEKSLSNFCPYKETLKACPSRTHRISRETNLFKMASQAKLSVMKIRKICVSGKALREEVVPERGSGKVYLDSCNSEW